MYAPHHLPFSLYNSSDSLTIFPTRSAPPFFIFLYCCGVQPAQFNEKCLITTLSRRFGFSLQQASSSDVRVHMYIEERPYGIKQSLGPLVKVNFRGNVHMRLLTSDVIPPSANVSSCSQYIPIPPMSARDLLLIYIIVLLHYILPQQQGYVTKLPTICIIPYIQYNTVSL